MFKAIGIITAFTGALVAAPEIGQPILQAVAEHIPGACELRFLRLQAPAEACARRQLRRIDGVGR
jgi:hypothetical protein